MAEVIRVPMLALRGNIIFPHVKSQIEVARDVSKTAIEQAIKDNNLVFLVSQLDGEVERPKGQQDFHQYGSLAQIVQVFPVDKDVMSVIAKTFASAKVLSIEMDQAGCWYAQVETVEYQIENETECALLYKKATELLEQYASMSKRANKDLVKKIIEQSQMDYITFVDIIGNEVALRVSDRQDLLSCNSVDTRLEILCNLLLAEIEIAKAEKRIANRVKKQVADGQKEYYLKEQMRAISAELGEDENEIQEYIKRIESCKMPKDTEKKAKKEINRLKKMAPTSPDAAIIRNYVDWLCDLPWYKETKDNKNLKRAKEILDEDHYGLEKIKERIIEYLAVMQLTGKLNGPILCFVGPPGVGKTSIVRSIARSLNRQYLRVSLGGVSDESEIRGHRRTYVGAIPGKIAYMMKQAGCVNPVMLFDEIDKLGKDHRGDPAAAMLEVLDPEQNKTFTDHFLEVPYDLSKVLFVCTANTTDDIPAPLLDRMEIIELSGYTEEEKVEIAQKFLLPKNKEKHGIPEKTFDLDGQTISKIIERYTLESGVRSLERQIAAVCRKVALKLVSAPDQEIKVNVDNLNQYLGVEQYEKDDVNVVDQVGTATGLAWTRVGGTTLNVDAALFPGKGDVQLTGMLGDVMKESARTAISLVRSLATEYGVDPDKFAKTDIHIHVPEGAIPKDGPSAGITMATVVLSSFANVPVSSKVAMTGEITLRGKVLPIGGLKEKAMAAYRQGVKTLIIPKENKKDLQDIPKEIVENINWVFADNIKTVFDNALVK